MRLVRFVEGSSCRVGVEISDGGKIVDVCAVDSSIPRDMKTFLEGGAKNLKAAERACKTAELSGQHVLERSRIHLKAPIHDPEKVICIGMNYSDHCEEQNKPIPKEPLIFSKFASAIIDPGAPIIYSEETQELDWEVELVIVIGRKGKNIKKEDAMQYVAGYTVAHDVSARDWQLRKNGGQWLIGKTFDSYCPLGPAIVTADSISDPHSLGIRCRVNGVVMQNSTTSKMVFRTEDLLAFISRFFTLNPGDIILTGTPPGVGCFRKPPIFLKKGDVVECEIDEIGSISNKVEAMPNIQANL